MVGEGYRQWRPHLVEKEKRNGSTLWDSHGVKSDLRTRKHTAEATKKTKLQLAHCHSEIMVVAVETQCPAKTSTSITT